VDLAAASQGQPLGVEPRVLVMTLSGKLGATELARCHRSLREAASRGCSWLVFRLEDAGSDGEDAGDLQSLFDHIQQRTVSTVAVLKGQVLHGAAALALCCDRVYLQPNAQWGIITKPEQEWTELLSAAPDAAMATRLDAEVAAMAQRLAARAEKLRPDAEKLALAMVDPRQQLVTAMVRDGGLERARVLRKDELATLQAGGAKVFGETTLPRPLLVNAQEAEDFGLSAGTLQGLDALADVLAIDRVAIGELTVNWAEQMVGWLELLQPFLLVAGFLLLIVEMKTPGVGLPGLLGVAFLALALFYSYLVGLAEVTEILVFFLGLVAIAVEIFLLPGTIVFGAVGFLCLVLSLVLSRQSFVLPSNAIEEDLLLANLGGLTLLFVTVMVLGAVLWRLLPRLPWLNRVFLAPPAPAASLASAGSGLGLEPIAPTALVGRVGLAASPLRPAGAMELDGERFDVITEGEFVAAGQRVRVLFVQGNRIVVAADGAPAGQRAGERGSVGLVVLLCTVGLCLVVAEVLLVSFGVIAALAAVALLSAVFVAFQHSITFGVAMALFEVFASLGVGSLAFKLLPKTRFGKQLILEGPTTSPAAAAADGSLVDLVQQTGVTVSPLRPAGFARIGGRKVDVVTRGEMLDADCPIVVLEVAGNRVVVARR
jgi:membrane-bound serine protease (ClpP class)